MASSPRMWSTLSSFSRNRWAILAASIWIQGCSGVGYAFGSISPLIKTTLGYNQRQINVLGVAKDMGDSVGLAAGALSEVLPGWGLLLVGALHNVLGYGCLWLIITQRLPPFPLWMICVLIFVGTNGETYLNTADLVVCVRNFPRSRGPIVGILKGFTGLCGAIFTQIYATFLAPDQAAFLFMVAVGPGMVVIALMFIIRPVPSTGVAEDSRIESLGFSYIYAVCLLLAAYLMGIMLVQDLVEVSHFGSLMMTIVLSFILFLPLATPGITTWLANKKAAESSPSLSDIEGSNDTTRPLLMSTAEAVQPPQRWGGGVFDDVAPSEMEDEKPQGLDLLPEHMRMRKLAELRQRLVYAAAEGAVRVKRKKGPRRGQDFTLSQALVKADFWLLFWILFCGAGSGLTVIDNLGQISESLGYGNAHIFVSMISIWNFLGRLAGGYLSELASRDYALPRPLVMGLAQAEMAVGHFLMAMAWPGALYVGTLLVGSGYGAHWAIVPASASELFGLKNFGILYNFITIALPSGSLFFSGLLAGTLYDWEAEKQQGVTLIYAHHLSNNNSSSGGHIVGADSSLSCTGAVCFRITFLVMTGVCILGIVLSMVLSFRTRTVYANLYGTTKPQPSGKASSKEEEG